MASKIDDHQISQGDYQKYDLYNYSKDTFHGDVQNIIVVLCDAHRDEVEALHKMYRELLDDMKHKLARSHHRATALSVAISHHNQKMMGNE